MNINNYHSICACVYVILALSKLVCHVKTVFVLVLLQLTYEFKKEDGQTVKEDVSVDVKDNFVQYHLNDDDSEVWVHDDFNRVSMPLR